MTSAAQAPPAQQGKGREMRRGRGESGAEVPAHPDRQVPHSFLREKEEKKRGGLGKGKEEGEGGAHRDRFAAVLF